MFIYSRSCRSRLVIKIGDKKSTGDIKRGNKSIVRRRDVAARTDFRSRSALFMFVGRCDQAGYVVLGGVGSGCTAAEAGISGTRTRVQ